MANNPELTIRIREALKHITDVEEKKMFRGITFMVNQKMCICVADNDIMCRIDPAMQAEALAHEGCRTTVMKGREYKGYVNVEENVLGTKKELDYWINLALAFNKEAKATPKKKK